MEPCRLRAHARERLTAANCTVCICEGGKDTLINISQFQRFYEDHGDLIMCCLAVEDIIEAVRTGRVGIVLGWQSARN